MTAFASACWRISSHGLVDVATDYGLILLAFTQRGMEQMEITAAGADRVGRRDRRGALLAAGLRPRRGA